MQFLPAQRVRLSFGFGLVHATSGAWRVSITEQHCQGVLHVCAYGVM